MATDRPISDADRQLAFGSPEPVAVPARAPDPLVDGLATDGVQPADRHSGGVHPTGGR
ncbi:MAG TPA: hypothetical protein VGJ59_22045 [Jatrophihabitantaceae bacterium]|jgi:hypothetical protein